MLSVVMLSVVMVNVVMLRVVMLSVIMLNVVMLSVVAPSPSRLLQIYVNYKPKKFSNIVHRIRSFLLLLRQKQFK
jgi:hypothetical protein